MPDICVYGTVHNSTYMIEESMKSTWKPEYRIVVVNNYSTDSIRGNLVELGKKYIQIMYFKDLSTISRSSIIRRSIDPKNKACDLV